MLKARFNTSYKDDTTIIGPNFLEIVGFGGVTIQAIQVGVAEKASDPLQLEGLGPNVQGVLGISFESSEAIVSDGGKNYPNFVGALVKNGYIKKFAYSLYLDEQGESSTYCLRLRVRIEADTVGLCSSIVRLDPLRRR